MNLPNYKVHKLDSRYNFHQYFAYYISFSHTTPPAKAALKFWRAKRWFMDTYGYSAEIHSWDEIRRLAQFSQKSGMWRKVQISQAWIEDIDAADVLNLAWSWSIGREAKDYRIYCASDKEVAFFQLAHKVDQ